MTKTIFATVFDVFAIILLAALLASGRTDAGELSRAELGAKFSPPFALGERDAQLPVYPVFRNEDLPNLRADWLRDQVRPLLIARQLDIGEIAILDNPPAQGHERHRRDRSQRRVVASC